MVWPPIRVDSMPTGLPHPSGLLDSSRSPSSIGGSCRGRSEYYSASNTDQRGAGCVQAVGQLTEGADAGEKMASRSGQRDHDLASLNMDYNSSQAIPSDNRAGIHG